MALFNVVIFINTTIGVICSQGFCTWPTIFTIMIPVQSCWVHHLRDLAFRRVHVPNAAHAEVAALGRHVTCIRCWVWTDAPPIHPRAAIRTGTDTGPDRARSRPRGPEEPQWNDDRRNRHSCFSFPGEKAVPKPGDHALGAPRRTAGQCQT